MIAVDTNVLVRALVDQADDPRQQGRARQALQDAEATGETIFVASLVVAETVWVLKSVARLSRSEIASVFADLLEMPLIQFEDRAGVAAGVEALRSGGPGMADQLLYRATRMAGARELLTFDSSLHRLEGCREP